MIIIIIILGYLLLVLLGMLTISDALEKQEKYDK